MEKDKLSQLQDAADHNVRLREQNAAMARQIELLQELATKEVSPPGMRESFVLIFW